MTTQEEHELRYTIQKYTEGLDEITKKRKDIFDGIKEVQREQAETLRTAEEKGKFKETMTLTEKLAELIPTESINVKKVKEWE